MSTAVPGVGCQRCKAHRREVHEASTKLAECGAALSGVVRIASVNQSRSAVSSFNERLFNYGRDQAFGVTGMYPAAGTRRSRMQSKPSLISTTGHLSDGTHTTPHVSESGLPTRTRAISKWLVGAFVLGQVVPSFVVWRVILFVQMLALTSK